MVDKQQKQVSPLSDSSGFFHVVKSLFRRYKIILNSKPGKDWEGAGFRDADLAFAKFQYAKLRDVDFSGANLMCVDFTGADLIGANLVDAKCLDGVCFKNAMMPNGDIYIYIDQKLI